MHRASSNLWLSCILVLCQINPRDGAKWSEELLQIGLAGVLRQVGHTDCSIVISCKVQSFSNGTQYWRWNAGGLWTISNSPLRLGCIDSPLRVLPSLRLGGTYFPVLACAGCTGSGSAGKKKKKKQQAILTDASKNKNKKTFMIWHQLWTNVTRTRSFLLVSSGKTKLFSQFLLHRTQGVLVWTAGCPVVAFANAAGHNFLSFQFVHGIFFLILGIQVLQEAISATQTQATYSKNVYYYCPIFFFTPLISNTANFTDGVRSCFVQSNLTIIVFHVRKCLSNCKI